MTTLKSILIETWDPCHAGTQIAGDGVGGTCLARGSGLDLHGPRRSGSVSTVTPISDLSAYSGCISTNAGGGGVTSDFKIY